MSKYATKEQLISIVQDMASKISVPTIGIGGGYAPIGTVISYMGVTAPQDYLACDGSTYNISAYSDLADFFQSQFGSKNYFGGDGTTTFAVPDLRGEFLRGTGTNSHANQGSGATVGAHQNATESLNLQTTASNIQMLGDSESTIGSANFDSQYKSGTGDVKWHVATATSNSTSNTKNVVTSRPTNTSILWCIKAVNAGDVYSTDERVVGTWIDGKSLYQKTVELTNVSLPEAQQITNVTLLSNATYNYIESNGIIVSNSSGNVDTLPLTNFDRTKGSIYYGARVRQQTQTQDKDIVLTLVNYNGSADTYTVSVTIRYTKTTDV